MDKVTEYSDKIADSGEFCYIFMIFLQKRMELNLLCSGQVFQTVFGKGVLRSGTSMLVLNPHYKGFFVYFPANWGHQLASKSTLKELFTKYLVNSVKDCTLQSKKTNKYRDICYYSSE